MDFEAFFKRATGNDPFPYQRRLATDEALYQLLDIPTGAGKTAAVILAWLWRRRCADNAVRQVTPRRLVYCLPMRVLVEQTVEAAQRWLNNLDLLTQVGVYVLMGGEEAEDWDVHPEREAILIGTQDMLLSRALNRGYGMSRYRWPMPFGLLNNDCLWALDEIQLMGSGLATSVQLQALREKLGVWGIVQTIWMSATLRRSWLTTVDFQEKAQTLSCLRLVDEDYTIAALGKRLQAKKPVKKADASAEETKKLGEIITSEHQKKLGLTLVVVNTVDRARTLYNELRQHHEQSPARRRRQKEGTVPMPAPDNVQPDLLLIHSRFRPVERKTSIEQLLSPVPEAGRIVVATQVVEAGVDISARTLFTELAPWASLVQRFGRCNRFGEDDDAQIFWIDIPAGKKNLAAPYDDQELEAARNVLKALEDVGLNSLAEYFEVLPDDTKSALFRYEPLHIMRRKDLIELFDTTPDLAGGDIDISRFIRDGHELDVQVFWREVKEPRENEKAPQRNELCPVPFYRFKDDFLRQRKKVYRWDILEHRWMLAEADIVCPGQVFLIPTDQGGYVPHIGWEPKSIIPVPPVPSPSLQPLEGNDDDLPSQDIWQTIAEHSKGVVAETESSADALGLHGELRTAVMTAARWHDRGKAHLVFQRAIHDGEKERPEPWRGNRALAKAPGAFWNRYSRHHFRHELATALAMLQSGLPPLAAYLAAAHHGKVRLSIRSLPNETRPDDASVRFARGVWDGDPLPETDLGDGIIAPAVTLSLAPMELGRSRDGQPSWAERVLRLRDDPHLGIFRLAFLEAVLRAADWRASDQHRRRGEHNA
jgi:CRISPR-associated endonuclease/helicase Cas3